MIGLKKVPGITKDDVRNANASDVNNIFEKAFRADLRAKFSDDFEAAKKIIVSYLNNKEKFRKEMFGVVAEHLRLVRSMVSADRELNDKFQEVLKNFDSLVKNNLVGDGFERTFNVIEKIGGTINESIVMNQFKNRSDRVDYTNKLLKKIDEKLKEEFENKKNKSNQNIKNFFKSLADLFGFCVSGYNYKVFRRLDKYKEINNFEKVIELVVRYFRNPNSTSEEKLRNFFREIFASDEKDCEVFFKQLKRVYEAFTEKRFSDDGGLELFASGFD